jgi:hypothetical protein
MDEKRGADSMQNFDSRRTFRREVIALLLFGIAFGYVEAAVVVYLRAIGEPIRERVLADRPHDEVFPLLKAEECLKNGYRDIAITELWREFATLVMLASVALLHARNVRQWFAGFIITFGMWDIFYYVFLRVRIDWPASLWTWDILFLLPVAWVSPVLAPVIVACEMVLMGIAILWREHRGTPIAFSAWHWIAMLAGAFIVVVSFCWDYKNVTAGGMPEVFNWPLFFVGDLLGAFGFVHAFAKRGAAFVSHY